jgi:hypothetical protein
MSNSIDISISAVLLDLKNGLTRQDIKEKYNLNGVQLKHVFSHPKLKFKKTVRATVQINIVDDTPETPVPVPTESIPNDNPVDTSRPRSGGIRHGNLVPPPATPNISFEDDNEEEDNTATEEETVSVQEVESW